MSERPIFGEELTARQQLRNQGLIYMLQGAGYGALFFVAILVFMFALVGLSNLLPEASKEMPDPVNRGALEQVVTVRTV